MTKSVALISGASRGIGAALAKAFAKEGYDLAICCSQDLNGLQDVQAQCVALGSNCFASLCNVRKANEVASFCSDAKMALGDITLLVNNAGISYVGLLTDMSDDDWNETIETNLSSAFYFCRNVIPDMVHAKAGHILNISSVWGNIGASTEVAYSASKGGINSFTKALAKELAPSYISVNAVACGLVDTSMNGHLTHEELEAICDEIPIGRMCEPDEVADLCVSLTKQSPYLTGQIITMDGGWS